MIYYWPKTTTKNWQTWRSNLRDVSSVQVGEHALVHLNTILVCSWWDHVYAKKYVQNILAKLGMLDCHQVKPPKDKGHHLHANMELHFCDHIYYKCMVDRLFFLTHIQPYICGKFVFLGLWLHPKMHICKL